MLKNQLKPYDISCPLNEGHHEICLALATVAKRSRVNSRFEFQGTLNFSEVPNKRRGHYHSASSTETLVMWK